MQSVIRAIKPEGVIQLDNEIYSIGGLNQNSTFLAYLNRSNLNLIAEEEQDRDNYDGTFTYVSHEIFETLQAPFPWTPGYRHSPVELSWPPKGVELRVHFKLAKTMKGRKKRNTKEEKVSTKEKLIRNDLHEKIEITIHYILYDGLPVLSKHMTVTCPSCNVNEKILVSSNTVELIACNALFGMYITHGSFPPGQDFGGAALSFTQGPLPLLLGKTDQAHSTSCKWQDDYPLSQNPHH